MQICIFLKIFIPYKILLHGHLQNLTNKYAMLLPLTDFHSTQFTLILTNNKPCYIENWYFPGALVYTGQIFSSLRIHYNSAALYYYFSCLQYVPLYFYFQIYSPVFLPPLGISGCSCQRVSHLLLNYFPNFPSFMERIAGNSSTQGVVCFCYSFFPRCAPQARTHINKQHRYTWDKFRIKQPTHLQLLHVERHHNITENTCKFISDQKLRYLNCMKCFCKLMTKFYHIDLVVSRHSPDSKHELLSTLSPFNPSHGLQISLRIASYHHLFMA